MRSIQENTIAIPMKGSELNQPYASLVSNNFGVEQNKVFVF